MPFHLKSVPEIGVNDGSGLGTTKPIFISSLIDTTKIKLKITKKMVAALHASDLKHDGYKFKVPGAYPGGIATIFSRPGQQDVYIEAGPKFLTGQNVVGIEDAHELTSSIVSTAFDRAGIDLAESVYEIVEAGDYDLMRVDYVAHCDCGSPERLQAVMLALRHLAVGCARDVSFYGAETLYIGQHSRRKGLKIYGKGAELTQRPIPFGVPKREQLTAKAQGLLRFEFVLRAEELKRLGLANVLALTPAIGRAFLQGQFDFITRAKGVIPDPALASELPAACRAKLRAWLLGDGMAFTSAPTTRASNRRLILRVTGIDIGSPIDAKTQREALLTVRQVLRDGIGFKSHARAWSALIAAAEEEES